ncbi:MAG TPA: Crp/Fnr family transcriptional regulator [Bacteroidia bacterium]|nr:Crp/Fnr family transcriptional regulator [Bacteroidia bacterium]
MKRVDCTSCENTSCLFKDSCSSKWRKKSRHKCGQHIFIEGIPVKGLYIVQKGEVKEYYHEKNGREKTNHTAKDGNIFGHIDYSGTKHLFSAIAIEDTQICCFSKKSLYEVCLNNSKLSNDLMDFFLDELIKSGDRRKILF